MKLRALVVEDCTMMRNLLMQMLPLTGLAEFRFVEAANGAEGLARFDPEKIEIVFADCNMPQLSGIEFVRSVRAMGNTRHIPIVMVTGVGRMSSVQEALDEAGTDLAITKPYTVEDLRKQLTPVIEAIRTQRETPLGGGTPEFRG